MQNTLPFYIPCQKPSRRTVPSPQINKKNSLSFYCTLRGSNSRLPPWEGDALTTGLRVQLCCGGLMEEWKVTRYMDKIMIS
jgi:hypothetical protein